MRNSKMLTSRLKDGAAAWSLIGLYMFFPMLVTFEMQTQPNPSGSPAAEAEELKNQTPTSGLGGPEEVKLRPIEKQNLLEEEEEENIFVIDQPDLTDPALTRPLQLFITGGAEPQVYRINYFKQVDAQLPVKATSEISSDFGWRTPPCTGCSADHRGVDFVPGAGEDVYAIMDGMVIESGYLGGYGYWVMLEHLVTNPNTQEMERWETVYAHMQEGSIPEDVVIGAVVERGDIIGKVGSTGMSTGPHLHFEIRIDGEQIDPLPLIASYQVVEVERDENLEERYTIKYR